MDIKLICYISQQRESKEITGGGKFKDGGKNEG